MKRGAKAVFIHFHSYPYTDKASLEKAAELVGILAKSNHRTQVYYVPFAEIQRETSTELKDIVVDGFKAVNETLPKAA